MLILPEIITGHGLALRLLTPADVAALHMLTNDPRIAAIISFLSYPVAEATIAAWIDKNRGDNDRVFGIFSDDSQLLGQISAHLPVLPATKTPPPEIEIGYWVGSAFTGRGVATRAVTLLARAASIAQPGHVVFAECLDANHGSVRVLEKCGFIKTKRPGRRPGRMRYVYRID